MNDEGTIKLTVGLGDLKFGATRDQARAYLGEPEEISMDGNPGDTSIAWYYWSRRLSVHFDEDVGFRLESIETSSPSASLDGKCLIGQSKREVLESIAGADLGDPVEQVSSLVDDGDDRSLVLHFSSHSLALWFEDNVLTEIQWGYVSDDDDQPIWPEE